MKFELPVPPSLNRLYRMTCANGYPLMYKSNEGKIWMDKARWIIKSKKFKGIPIDGEIMVYISVFKKRKTDIDNFLKASFDVLEESGIIKNDSQISELHIYRNKAVKKEYMEVEIQQWED